MRIVFIAFLLSIHLFGGIHIIMKKSNNSYERTVQKLQEAIQATIFKKSSLIRYHNPKLYKHKMSLFLIYNDKILSVLTQGDSRVVLEFPLRLLVYQNGKNVFIVYHSPIELMENYHVQNPKAIRTLEKFFKVIVKYASQ